jgi:NAD(P)H-flavin reductase
LEQPPPGWTQGRGRITEDILRGYLPPPVPETVVFLCGPPLMVNALEGTLKDIGYPEESIVLP